MPKACEVSSRELIRIMEQAYRGGEAVHEVEYKLFRQLMTIGHGALGLLFE